MSDPYPHNTLPRIFEPSINLENPYMIERGRRGSSYLVSYKTVNFPEISLKIKKKWLWSEGKRRGNSLSTHYIYDHNLTINGFTYTKITNLVYITFP